VNSRAADPHRDTIGSLSVGSSWLKRSVMLRGADEDAGKRDRRALTSPSHRMPPLPICQQRQLHTRTMEGINWHPGEEDFTAARQGFQLADPSFVPSSLSLCSPIHCHLGKFTLMTSTEPSFDIALHMHIPALESFVDVIRTAVGRIAQLIGFTFDGIEDLALAANEAAALLLDLAPHTLEIEVLGPVEAGAPATVALKAVRPEGRWPPPDLESDIRWQVLTAVCEEVQVRLDDPPGLVILQGAR
jgi:hypothetical protein